MTPGLMAGRRGRAEGGAYLGEGPAGEVVKLPPPPPPACCCRSGWPLSVPAADITADIMALMGDKSPPPPPRSPFCSFFSPSVGPLLTAQRDDQEDHDWSSTLGTGA